MSHPNWLEIRTAYEAGGVGYRGLAERFNVGVATIARRAKREAWQAHQGEVHAAMTSAAVKAATEAGKELGLSVARLEEQSLDIAGRLFKRIGGELDKPDTGPAEIRALAGAFRDAVTVGRLTHRLDEQRAEVPLIRGDLLARLADEIQQQRELKRARDAGEVVIDISPEASAAGEAEPTV
jgi:hypothetical protein